MDDKIATNLEVASTLDEIGAIQFQKIAENSPRSPVGDVATLVLGGTPNRSVPEYWNGSVPWIASGACNQKIVTQPTEFITELGLERSAAKMLPAKTTVVAITGATLGKMGWLGSAMSANQSVVGVHAHSTPAWIYHALRSEQTQLMNWATGGAQQHVNKGAVAAIEVPFESNRAQVFEALIGPLMDRAVFAMQENATLTAVRDELLPQLMSGRITVKDAEKRVEEEV
nr:restriction endonuclease subunit S [Micrococcus luteus]